MTASSLAAAHQFEFGISQQIRAESNIFGDSPEKAIADGVYVLMPRVEVSGRIGEFEGGRYSLAYRPSYLFYFISDDVDGLDNRASADLEFTLTPADRLRANASYVEYNSVQAISQENPDGGFDVLPEDRGETIRALGNITYSREQTRKSRFSVDFNFQDYSYPESRNVGNKSIAASGSYTQAISPRLTLGAGLTARYRIFADQPQYGVGSSTVTVANLNILGSYALSRTLSFEFMGGPSLIRTEPGAVVGAETPPSGSDLTYFMNLLLNLSRKDSDYRASYRRDEDASGGSNRTSVADTFSGSARLRIDELWRVGGNIGWNRRQTVDSYNYTDDQGNPLPFSQVSQLDRAWVGLTATRLLGEKFLLTMGFRYQRWLDHVVGGVQRPTQDNYTGSLRLDYEFDPIAL